MLRRHSISGSVAAALWTASRDLVRRTRRRGIEHAITLDAGDGHQIDRTRTGTATQTDLTPQLLAMQRGHTYVQLHTHPTSPSFSALDVRILADHPAIITMVAIGVDGTWYVMSRLDETSIGDRRAVFDDFLIELNRLGGQDIAPVERPHLVMEYIAARHGLRYDRVTGPSHGQEAS